MTQNQVGTVQGQGKKRSKKHERKGGEQRQQPRLSPEQRLEENIKLVREEGQVPVPRRALETNGMIALLRKNDYLVDRIRDRMVADDNINTERAIKLLKRNREIREELNRVNLELCDVMNMTYKPPKGFETARAEQKPGTELSGVAEEKELEQTAVNA